MRLEQKQPLLVLCVALQAVKRGVSLSLPKTNNCERQLQNPQLNEADGRRRDFLGSVIGAGAALLTPSVAAAAEGGDDLTSQLFNEDGSLKEGVESEAKFRTVEFEWADASQTSGEYLVNIDGRDTVGKKDAGASVVKISYDLPLKWKGGSGSDLYTDLTVENSNVKALSKITIYQPPGLFKQSQLEKASTIGVAKALQVLPGLEALNGADLVGGRVRTVGGSSSNNSNQKLFDFDMAVAPKTCGQSQENLGLGFCPFDTIYLLSGTVVNERLYVFALECDKDQWKRSNSDLKKIRSTFTISPS